MARPCMNGQAPQRRLRRSALPGTVRAGSAQDGKSPDPLFHSGSPHDLHPTTPFLQDHYSREITPEDNQAISNEKKDLEKLMRADSLLTPLGIASSSKVSCGDGYQQLIVSPFAKARPLFPFPDLLETPRLMKSPLAFPMLQRAIITQGTQK